MSDYEETHVPDDDAVVFEKRNDESDERYVPKEDVVRRVVSCQCADCLFQALAEDDDEAEDVARDHLEDVDPDPESEHVIDIFQSPKTRFD